MPGPTPQFDPAPFGAHDASVLVVSPLNTSTVVRLFAGRLTVLLGWAPLSVM